MIIRSKAPLRLGLAGGGTDVSPYCDKYGGCVLNATINLYTYCNIIPNEDSIIKISATDRNEYFKCESKYELPIDGNLDLHKEIYNTILKKFKLQPLSFDLITYSDAPAGSGLGTSSTLVVCIIQAFIEWLNLPLGEYDIAQLAYQIERINLKMVGGKQDQYAAAFGGFNFIEFYSNNRVIVNPLRIKDQILNELEASALIYFTGTSRSSSLIIKDQINSIKNIDKLDAMHQIKNDAYLIKESILTGNYKLLYNTMIHAWNEKKKTSNLISNNYIDDIYETAINAGAYCGKVSGAGGGGFMFFFIDPIRKIEIIETLKNFDGHFVDFKFVQQGVHSWKINS